MQRVRRAQFSYKTGFAINGNTDLALFLPIGLAAVIAAGLGWPQRTQLSDTVLGRVYGDVAGDDGIHGAAWTEAGGGDGRSGAEMRTRTARTEARGGSGDWTRRSML